MKSNRTYVEKMSTITDHYLEHMLQNIIVLANLAGNHTLSQTDLEEWFGPNQESFNSIFVTDANGVIDKMTPEDVRFKDGETVSPGLKITIPTFRDVLEQKEPVISEPYRATSGQLITLISAPIFDSRTGEFRGVIAGTIHMKSENVLNYLLSDYIKDEETYVYVVDKTGKLIYHPDRTRLSEDVSENEVVQQLLQGKSGS